MVAKYVTRSLGLLFLATSAVACGQPGGDEDAKSSAAVAVVVDNGLTANGLTANGLTANGLIANGLTANGLTANGLTANGLTANGLIANGLTPGALSDPLARQFLKYVVSCALTPDQSLSFSVDGTTYTLPGSVGLAPEWGKANGSCDGSCQRWVSACVLARVDAAGIDREISIRGPNLALFPSWSELTHYTQREATYFGNLFIPGQPRFLCLPPGQKDDERVCGDSMDDCPMTVLPSTCAKDCAFRGLFGDYDFCSDAGRFGTGQTYLESVTVFLPK